MKAILLTFSVLLVGIGAVCAQIYDRGVTRQHNLVNPFASQHKIVRPWDKRVKPRGLKQKIRPGRNVDNPAANQFGDGSPPNTYVPGRKKRK